MPDGNINMVACAKDENLAGHNLFWQHSAWAVLTFASGVPSIPYNVNVVSAARIGGAGSGTFEIVVLPFDYKSAGPVYPLFPFAFFGSTVGAGMGVSVRVMDQQTIRVYTQVLTTGALADPADTSLIHFLCFGRRVNQGQNGFVAFRTMLYAMGVSGWDGT